MRDDGVKGARSEEDEAAASLVEAAKSLPLPFRLAHGALCAAAGAAGLWEGIRLLGRHDLFEAAFALLVVEPFSLYFLAGGLAELAPDSPAAKWFGVAVRMIANRMWILAVLMAGSVLAMAAWWLWLVLAG